MKVVVNQGCYVRFEDLNKGDVFTCKDSELFWMKTDQNGTKDSVCLNDGAVSEAAGGKYIRVMASLNIEGVK